MIILTPLFSLGPARSAVRVLLQYVQRILEGVQHDRNQPGDPGSEHRHWGWEKASQQTAVDVCLIVYPPILNAVCLCSSPSGVWVSIPGWCSDQAQPGRQYSCRCLYATAGQCTAHNRIVSHVESDQFILEFAVMSCYVFYVMSCVLGWFDPAVWRDHEGKHQC